MDFSPSPRVVALRERLTAFVARFVYPNERTYQDQIAASGDPHHRPAIVDELKARARAEGTRSTR
jgi:acyl-CoA dehydrogenase